MHAASLIKEIKTINPGIHFTGIGGHEMRKENVDLLYDIKQVNYIGFSSVLRNYGKLKTIFNKCIDSVKSTNPSAVILVDYPGFNLKFIKSIRKFYKGKVIYYISPQLWAWHKSRVNTIRKFVDLMLVVFPFEVDFYKNENVKSEYVGHPLMKKVNTFLKNNHRTKSIKKQISILPGSRKDEIERMMPVLVKTAEIFKDNFDCEINFVCSVNYDKSYFKNFIPNNNFNLIYDNEKSELNYKTILNSDLVITKSGTSTVECALLGTPFCVVYKAGKLNYLIGKNLVKVKFIAMVNILLGKLAVKEFLQKEMTPDNIFAEGKKILTDIKYKDEMLRNFRVLRDILSDKDASQNAARSIMSLLNDKFKI